MPKEMSKIDHPSDMEINIKSRDGSALDSSRIIKGEAHEELLNSGNVDSRDSIEVVFWVLPSRESPDKMNSLPNSEERDLEGMDLPRSHPPHEKEVEGSEGIEQESNTKLSDNEKICNDHQILQGDNKDYDEAFNENRCSSEGIEQGDDTKLCSENKGSHKDHQTLQGVGHEIEEVMDSDDKENAQASDGNRDFNNNNHQSERRILSGQETRTRENKKVVRTFAKNKKDCFTSAITGAPNVKYRKPKPTNPKPFRLRTDERGILKEANMEGKIPTSQKEAATVPRCLGGISQRSHGNGIKRNEKCSELSKCRNDECCNKESQKKVQKVEYSSSKGQTGSKLATRTPERRLKPLQPEPNSTAYQQHEHTKDNACQKSQNNSRKTTLQRQLIRPQGQLQKTSLITPEQPLSVIKETSFTTKFKEIGKPNESAATAFAASGSFSQGRRRPLTIPKEPNFHSANVPRSCSTRNTA